MTAADPSAPDERVTTVVRPFPDYARSVICMGPDPVDYAETALDEDYIAELRAWDRYARIALGRRRHSRVWLS